MGLYAQTINYSHVFLWWGWHLCGRSSSARMSLSDGDGDRVMLVCLALKPFLEREET